MRRRLRDLDGRVLAGVVVVVFFTVLLSFKAFGPTVPWAHVGVEPGDKSFVDLRSVTSSWDCERRGVQAFPNNPCDPFGRPANYPRVWTQVGRVGLGEGDTVPLGIALAVLFFVSALAVVGPLTLGEGAVYGATLLAPATLLGVERGNVDLLMFALVALGVLLVRRSSWLAAAPIVLGAILKIFPIFGLALFVRARSRWPALLASVIVFGAYAIATLDDIRTLRHVIPRVVVNSYGAGVVVEALRLQHVSWVESAAAVRYVRLGVIVLGLLPALVLLLVRHVPGARVDDVRIDAFWAGAGIYVGTYVFGSNFDYRLVFLVLCVPQLYTWWRRGGSPVPSPFVALVTLVATLWLSSSQPPLPFGLQTWYVGLAFPPDEVLNWALFAWLCAALAAGACDVLTARRTAAEESTA
jgi:hypothetical protein